MLNADVQGWAPVRWIRRCCWGWSGPLSLSPSTIALWLSAVSSSFGFVATRYTVAAVESGVSVWQDNARMSTDDEIARGRGVR